MDCAHQQIPRRIAELSKAYRTGIRGSWTFHIAPPARECLMSEPNPLPSDELDQLFAAPETVPADHLSPVAKEALLPATQPGAESTAPTVPSQTVSLRFEDYLKKFTPQTWVTPACLVANVAYFIYMVSRGVDYLQPDVADLLKWGANYAPLTWGGQPWRLLSSIFMHCGLIHLALNMWALWSAGRIFERLVGSVGFLIIYLSSGISGGLASAWWNGDVVSAGASGAIFGILGAFTSFIWNRSDSFPPQALRQLRGNLAMCIGINLLFGATFPGIDQAAHLGGLLAGFVLGCVVSQPLDQLTTRRRTQKNLMAGALSVLVLGILIALHPAPPADLQKELAIYDEVVPRTIEKFEQTVKNMILNNLKTGNHPDAPTIRGPVTLEDLIEHGGYIDEEDAKQLVELVEKEILPDWERVIQHLNSLQNVARGHRQLVNRMKTQLALRDESWRLMLDAYRRDDKRKLADFKIKWNQAEAVQEQIQPRLPQDE